VLLFSPILTIEGFTFTYLSPLHKIVASSPILKVVWANVGSWVPNMINCATGKLFVYASSFSQKRLRPVSIATEKMARLLKLNFEIRTFRKCFVPIYVYYETGDEEPIPIYCNSNGQSSMDEVYLTLRNMMFVLSFHPKHQALRYVRKEIMQFS
jgi:hypothetical protein